MYEADALVARANTRTGGRGDLVSCGLLQEVLPCGQTHLPQPSLSQPHVVALSVVLAVGCERALQEHLSNH